MYRGQFLPSTGYRVLRRFFAESGYWVFTLIITAWGEWGSRLSI